MTKVVGHTRRHAVALLLVASLPAVAFAQDARRELATLKSQIESALLREEWSEIERLASRIVDLGDTDQRRAAGYADRALALINTSRPRRALEDIERAIELDPERAEWRARRGDIVWSMGRRDEARRDYEAALDLDPRDFVARQGLARMGIRR
jgi:tetratricopeptide (TPR) repeat protein